MPAQRRPRDPSKEQRWRRIIRRHQASGLSVRAFCEGEGIKECNFLRWRRELSRRDREEATPLPNSATQGPTGPRAAPTFLPVRVVGADRSPHRPVPPIEIVLPTGPTVRVPSGFDPRTLGDVLAVLGGRSC